MMNQPTMLTRVEDYLTSRRQMGFALAIAGNQLLAFARFADASGHCGPVTLDLAVRWARTASPPITFDYGTSVRSTPASLHYCIRRATATGR